MTSLVVRQQAGALGAFIDVGANVGFYSVLVGRENPACRVLSFEPVPANIAALRRNLKLNNVAAEVHDVAVSDVAGRGRIQVSSRRAFRI